MLARNFKKYFLADDILVASYKCVRDPFQNTPEGLSSAEEEIFIDFMASGEIKRQFSNKSLFEFGAGVDDEFSAHSFKIISYTITIFNILTLQNRIFCGGGFEDKILAKYGKRTQSVYFDY
ncbi:hypothetical protein AVEN_119754-1 [Araneus ventricosus]|uniref:Uncharacterized protein n=1 Tax=Araneus ventricosus TaxID=182803 RepID=A0A4Y2FCH2_ARAVE|nr:hypothetical protein AVEN_119754-1 [Araneus ventricosus]